MITICNEFEVGETVLDDLTNATVTIIGITFQRGQKTINGVDAVDTIGYWINNKYLGGGRHPWELTKIEENRC